VIVTEETVDGHQQELGDSTWAVNTRPDVTAAFPNFPNSSRAEWNYILDCPALKVQRQGTMRIHAIAVDSEGFRSDLGSRRIRLSQYRCAGGLQRPLSYVTPALDVVSGTDPCARPCTGLLPQACL